MEKVEVFHFRVYDPTKDEIIVPAFKSTRKRIEGDLIKGEIIPHTGQMVFVSDEIEVEFELTSYENGAANGWLFSDKARLSSIFKRCGHQLILKDGETIANRAHSYERQQCEFQGHKNRP